MPEGWTLKKKVVRSRKFRELYSDSFTQLVYCLLIAVKDSWGMVPADSDSLKAELGPFDTTRTPEDYAAAVDRLHEVRLVYKWDNQGDPWIYMIGHDEEHRIRRSKHPPVPRPDLEMMNMWSDVGKIVKPMPNGVSLQANWKNNLPRARELELELEREGEREGVSPRLTPSPPSQKSEDQELAPATRDAPGPPPSLEPTSGGSTVRPGGASDCDPRNPSLVAERPPSSSAPSSGSDDEPQTLPPVQVSGAGAPLDAGTDTPLSLVETTQKPTPTRHKHQDSDEKPKAQNKGSNGFSDAITHTRDKRPISHEHTAIQELQALWAKTWDKPQPTGPPSGDNMQRVLQALRSPRFGFDACRAAIHGHHKLASKEGSQRGKEFRLIFPEARIGNNRHSCKLDEDRFEEFVVEGKHRVVDKVTDEKRAETKRKRLEQDESEAKAFIENAGIVPGDKPKDMLRKAIRKGGSV